MSALKIGALAVRQAQGCLDAELIRSEGERFIAELGKTLNDHEAGVTEKVAASLKEYFDPTSGRFVERVERLIKKDGDLERLLQSQIGPRDSLLTHTLATHLGERSPLVTMLDPASSNGFLSSLIGEIEKTVDSQRELILREFSLDNKNGALSRLVSELTERHGRLGEALEKRIDEVTAEFSLDRKDSALSRLVDRVERAQRQISSELSMDREDSALARMRRELLTVESQRCANDNFQRDVLKSLTEITARRVESERSTRHGDDFEGAVFDSILARSQKAGDIATSIGTTTGVIRNCKVGDVLVELGPDSAAPASRIVAEAKEQAGFGLSDALKALEQARKNREAEVGLFVFSSRVAPQGLETLARYGDDIVLVWNAEDPRTDVS